MMYMRHIVTGHNPAAYLLRGRAENVVEAAIGPVAY